MEFSSLIIPLFSVVIMLGFSSAVKVELRADNGRHFSVIAVGSAPFNSSFSHNSAVAVYNREQFQNQSQTWECDHLYWQPSTDIEIVPEPLAAFNSSGETVLISLDDSNGCTADLIMRAEVSQAKCSFCEAAGIIWNTEDNQADLNVLDYTPKADNVTQMTIFLLRLVKPEARDSSCTFDLILLLHPLCSDTQGQTPVPTWIQMMIGILFITILCSVMTFVLYGPYVRYSLNRL